MEKKIISKFKYLALITGMTLVLIAGCILYLPFTSLEAEAVESVSVTD